MSRYEEFESRVSNQIHKAVVMTLGGAGLSMFAIYFMWLVVSVMIWCVGLIRFTPRADVIDEWVTWCMIWNFGWQVHFLVIATIAVLIASHIFLGRVLRWRRYAYLCFGA